MQVHRREMGLMRGTMERIRKMIPDMKGTEDKALRYASSSLGLKTPPLSKSPN